MIKAILWDNDGVLVNTERLYFAATQQVFATLGIYLSKDQFIKDILVQGKGAWHLAIKKGVSTSYIQELRIQRDNIYSSLLSQQSNVIKGAREVLQVLYQRFRMGIVTSSRKIHFDIIHQSSGLLKYFDFVITGEDYTKFKPDPEPYILAIKKSGFEKQECVAIEDSERGLSSAKNAGLICYVIPTELTSTGDFSSADKVLTSITEVIEVLK